MSRIARWMALVVVLIFATTAWGKVKDEYFEAETTADFLELCTVAPDDPHAAAAVHFCHGYLVGAFDYHTASRTGPDRDPLFCYPENGPSQDEAVEMFVAWARARPQHNGEMPVETEFRWLIETWPCKD